MRKITVLVLMLALAVFPVLTSRAESKEQAVNLVKKAAAFYAANDLEKTLDELSNPKGQFRDGSLYVFAYDLTGTMVAHPNNALIGQNLIDVPDSDGKLFRKEIVEVANTKGSGWVDYKYQNPKTKEIQQKTTYVEKANDLIVCCGIYK